MITNAIDENTFSRPVSDGEFKAARLDQQLSIKNVFHNTCRRPITIVARNGLKYTVPPQLAPHIKQGLWITSGFETMEATEVQVSPVGRPLEADGTLAERLFASRKRYGYSVSQGRQQASEAYSFIPMEDIMEAGGSVYDELFDIMISLHQSGREVFHPFTPAGKLERLRLADASEEPSLQLTYYLVDNQRRIGDRYMNVNGRVFRIPRRVNPHLHDGFYAVEPLPPRAGGVETEIESVYRSIEDADKGVPLWRTIEEAETFGFSKEALERENLTRKREQTFKQDVREEIKYERSEQQRLAAEQRENAERLNAEKREKRKDIIDLIKWVVGIVSAAGTLFGLGVKFASKK